MEDIVKLFDIRNKNYPNKRGDSFRTAQVFVCTVCGAKTNLAVMGGAPGLGVRTICPHTQNCWHHELEDKADLLRFSHPKSYKEELQKDIEEIKKKYAHEIVDDIQGSPDFSLTDFCSNVRSVRRCEHWNTRPI